MILNFNWELSLNHSTAYCLQTLAVPRMDEWTKFVHTLQDLKTEQTEQEDEANLMSSPYR